MECLIKIMKGFYRKSLRKEMWIQDVPSWRVRWKSRKKFYRKSLGKEMWTRDFPNRHSRTEPARPTKLKREFKLQSILLL